MPGEELLFQIGPLQDAKKIYPTQAWPLTVEGHNSDAYKIKALFFKTLPKLLHTLTRVAGNM